MVDIRSMHSSAAERKCRMGIMSMKKNYLPEDQIKIAKRVCNSSYPASVHSGLIQQRQIILFPPNLCHLLRFIFCFQRIEEGKINASELNIRYSIQRSVRFCRTFVNVRTHVKSKQVDRWLCSCRERPDNNQPNDVALVL